MHSSRYKTVQLRHQTMPRHPVHVPARTAHISWVVLAAGCLCLTCLPGLDPGADGRAVAPEDATTDAAAADEAPNGASSASATLDASTPVPAASSSAAPQTSAQPQLVSMGFAITATYPEKAHTWRQVEQFNWQASADDLLPLAAEHPVDAKQCPAGMVLVDGQFILDLRSRDDSDEIMFAQNEACTRWLTLDRGFNGLCDRFDRDRWQAISARFPRKRVRFCMDRYEFPNTRGEYPLVVVTFSEAERYCTKVDKRLCTESEWTLACEGEEGLPFPYGYERDASACRIGILGPAPDKDTFVPRTLSRTARGIDLAWRGLRSGESARCVSPFSIEDMTGNVDEWTRSVRAYGYKMILKGGHWGAGRQRCRPQTRGHGPQYVRYDQGLRCCRDAAEP